MSGEKAEKVPLSGSSTIAQHVVHCGYPGVKQRVEMISRTWYTPLNVVESHWKLSFVKGSILVSVKPIDSVSDSDSDFVVEWVNPRAGEEFYDYFERALVVADRLTMRLDMENLYSSVREMSRCSLSVERGNWNSVFKMGCSILATNLLWENTQGRRNKYTRSSGIPCMPENGSVRDGDLPPGVPDSKRVMDMEDLKKYINLVLTLHSAYASEVEHKVPEYSSVVDGVQGNVGAAPPPDDATSTIVAGVGNIVLEDAKHSPEVFPTRCRNPEYSQIRWNPVPDQSKYREFREATEIFSDFFGPSPSTTTLQHRIIRYLTGNPLSAPHNIARELGTTKQEINRELYQMQSAGLVAKTSQSGGSNPLWSAK